MKYLAKILWESSLILLVQCSLAFRFTLLELVKGGYRGAKNGRGGRVECKGWNLTIDFSVVVLRQEGTRRVRMGSFWLLGGPPYILLTPESCDSYMMTLPVM